MADPALASNPFGLPPDTEDDEPITEPAAPKPVPEPDVDTAQLRRERMLAQFEDIDVKKDEVSRLNAEMKDCWDRCTKEIGLTKPGVKMLYDLWKRDNEEAVATWQSFLEAAKITGMDSQLDMFRGR